MKLTIAIFVLFLTSCSNSLAHCNAAEPPITDVAFSSTGSTLLACSQAGIQVLNWPDLTKRQLIKVDADNLHDLQFSPDGSQLAVAGGRPSETGIAVVYSWPDAKVVAKFVHEGDSFLSVAWVNQNQLILGCLDRTVIQWDTATEKTIRILAGHSKSVTSVCSLRQSNAFVTAGFDHSVRVWNSDTGVLIRSMNQHTHPVRHLALQPATSGRPMVASASNDRTIRFWQPTIGRMVRYIRLDTEPLKVAWIDDFYLASVCTDGTVRVIDVANVKMSKRINILSGWAFAVDVHPITRDLVVAGEGGKIKRVPYAEFSAESLKR